MASGKVGQIVQLVESGAVTTAPATLKAVVFTGEADNDKLEIRDGGVGGTVRMTLVVDDDTPAIIPIPDGAVFVTDIYAVLTLSGSGYATFVYELN